MRERVVQRRIDEIRARSDDRNRAAGTAQPAPMRRAVDTERKSRHHRQPRIRQRLGEAPGIFDTLRRCAPAADNRYRPRLKQVQPPLYI